jgi:putative SOS response-associated peptidase YedK
MCGRATVVDKDGLDVTVYGFTYKMNPYLLEAPPRYNIRPTEQLPIFRADGEGSHELTELRWGLIPGWSKDPAAVQGTFNARGETVHEKPSFRAAFKKRRCLILVDGFYEWPKKPSKDRNPRYFRMRAGGAFALAGLWERWRDDITGVSIESCTIITTEANELLASLPHDRMPVVLPRHDWDQWLDPAITDAAKVLPLIAPFNAKEMSMHVTDAQFVNYGVDDERCIEELAA